MSTLDKLYPEITPRALGIGDVISSDGERHLLAQVGNGLVAAIGLGGGMHSNRYTDPVKVNHVYTLTREELIEIVNNESLSGWEYVGRVDDLLRSKP